MTRCVDRCSPRLFATLDDMLRRHRQHDSRLGGLGLSAQEVAALQDACTVIDVPVGSFLCHQDRPGRQLVWIVEGIATVSRGDETIALVGTGDVVGEGTMVGAHDLCSADVVARTPMTLVVLSRQEWRTAATRAPSLVGRLFHVALDREPALAA